MGGWGSFHTWVNYFVPVGGGPVIAPLFVNWAARQCMHQCVVIEMRSSN